jgi:hypothetical protein
MERFPDLEHFWNTVDFLRAGVGDFFLMKKRLKPVLSIRGSLAIAVGIVKVF